MNTPAVMITNQLPSADNISDERILLDTGFQYYIDEAISNAEKEGEQSTKYLSDIDMVYHYIHHSTNIHDEKQRKNRTKKTYLREIMSFCNTLTTHADEFDIKYEDVQREKSFLKALQPWNIRKFNTWIKTVKNGKDGKSYAIATLSRKLTIINSFLLHLYRMDYITQPLHDHLKKATVRAEDRPDRDLFRDEVQQLLKYYKQRNHLFNYMILLFLATTGLRIHEVANANVGDLYHAEGKLWLRVVGKREKVRDAYIPQHLFDAICEYRERKGFATELNRSDSSPLLISNRLGRFNSTYLSNKVTKIIEETKLPFVQQREVPITAHTFRHGFAIIAAENDVELLRIQQTLGHASANTTKIYLEKHMKRKHNAALHFADSLI